MSKRLAITFLFILSIFPLVDLLRPGLPVTHDGQDHVARIANFYQSLTEGNIVPRWAANLNWGYGHPILMFLYPLPSYLASFFHALGFSFVDSTKLVFAVAFIASIIVMFVWVSEAWGVLAGIVAGLLYGFAPYRFVDLYVRGAIGEHVAFVFPPLVLYGLFRLAKKEELHWQNSLIALSMSGLLLSHNAVSLMFLPIIVAYIIYLHFFEAKQKKRFLILSIFYLLLGFILSAFFWMPAFFEGKYTLRDIVIKGDFQNRFVPFQWFFYSPWNYGGGTQFSKSLGMFHWVGVVLSIIIFWKLKSRKVRWFIFGNLVIFSISLFLMLPTSSFIWGKISLLQKFQFPWRLLTLSVFSTSLLGAMVAISLPKKFYRLSIVTFTILIILVSFQMWHSQSYSAKPEDFYTGIYDSTTDTGESSPIWSTRFMERRAREPIEVIEGSANISPLIRKSTRHEYSIEAKTITRFVENTLYFPGWNMYDNKKLLPIEFQDPQYRGLMTFWLEPGSHHVVLTFGDTKLRTLANILSLVGFAGLGVFVIIPIWRKRRQ